MEAKDDTGPDTERVLATVTAQTGLTFKKEQQKVPMFVLSLPESVRSPNPVAGGFDLPPLTTHRRCGRVASLKWRIRP